MLNWDEPLTPQVSRPLEPAVESTTPEKIEPVVVAAAHAVHSADSAPQQVPTPTPAASAKPINPEDKRVVNGLADINQLAPFKYPWAWDYFLNANKNHWTPLDINMTQDRKSLEVNKAEIEGFQNQIRIKLNN